MISGFPQVHAVVPLTEAGWELADAGLRGLFALSINPIEWSMLSFAALGFLLGACVGAVLVKPIVRWADGSPWSPPLSCRNCGNAVPAIRRLPLIGYWSSRGRCPSCGHPREHWIPLLEIGTGLLFAAFVIAVLRFECQQIAMVIPDDVWRYGRIGYHLALITLLIAATGTDLRRYVIPDAITVSGMVVGIVGATWSGQFQMVHLWIDWSHEIPGYRPPYVPGWIDQYRHWHGLVWSLTGLLVGGGLTWLVRGLSSRILGRESLGFGDVTLMAMIGSFMGWQPVLFVFFLAPLCGLMVAVFVHLFHGRHFIPYGPSLCLAAVVVLMSWRWLWTPVRDVFGDGPSLAILGGVSLTALVALLGLLRWVRGVPDAAVFDDE